MPQAGIGEQAGAINSLASAADTLFGSSGRVAGSGNFSEIATTSSKQSDKLNIDQEGIDKIIRDVLGGADGLAAIFQGAQTAGIFNSSVAAQAAGDLASRLAGEIAKLTAERVTTQDTTGDKSGTSEQASEEKDQGVVGGFLSKVGDVFGF